MLSPSHPSLEITSLSMPLPSILPNTICTDLEILKYVDDLYLGSIEGAEI